jgi:puromycin-sensitive aminopeptidase
MPHYDTADTSVSADVYRLPTTVTPEYYQIHLTPDLGNFTFAGEETVAVMVNEPVQTVTLNAVELQIDAVAAQSKGREIAGTAEFDPLTERVFLHFMQPLEAGQWMLKLVFRGILNDKLHGFYRSSYKDAEGRTHIVASTQFEATDARRAFPCWDEPALKATFALSLVIDEHLMAISNTAIAYEHALGAGKKEVVFRQTIRMSTYLMAFVVGEFEATAPVMVDGVPLRVVHVPGKEALTGWALQVGAFSLKFFADYYGIKYPGDKLDLIAIPDFASGAMENLGAITFRETALLVDETTASRAELERVADVVCHENAHMWFGDLVTMKWWNGLWLNEAFATFMEMMAVDAWKPAWERWTTFGVSRATAMAVDGLNSTRPIEYTVTSPQDAGGMFDVLTYEKGAAVLRMLEMYLGSEEFRKGISLYLHEHEYANAETSDLWDALELSSKQPVRKMMDSWIFQPGFPILSVDLAKDGRSLMLRQQRFLYAQDGKPGAQLWHVPVMIKAMGEGGVVQRKLLMTTAEATVELPTAIKWAVVNQNGYGFYRVRYAAELLQGLTAALDQLLPIERFALVSDTWAATVSGLASLHDYFAMASLFRNENDLIVWRALLGSFSYLDTMVEAAQRPALAAWVRELIAPAVERLGWQPQANENPLVSQLRGNLIGALGTVGDDAAVQTRARELYGQSRRQPGAVDNNLLPALIGIVAHTGSEEDYREFKSSFKAARTPQEEQRYLFALADFRRAELLRETMQMTVNGEVRTQNAPYLMQELLHNNQCRDEAWDFMREHWDTMLAQYPENAIPRMCEGVTALVAHEPEVVEFLRAHPVKQGGKTIEQHLERLHIAVLFRQREILRLPVNLGLE